MINWCLAFEDAENNDSGMDSLIFELVARAVYFDGFSLKAVENKILIYPFNATDAYILIEKRPNQWVIDTSRLWGYIDDIYAGTHFAS